MFAEHTLVIKSAALVNLIKTKTILNIYTCVFWSNLDRPFPFLHYRNEREDTYM